MAFTLRGNDWIVIEQKEPHPRFFSWAGTFYKHPHIAIWLIAVTYRRPALWTDCHGMHSTYALG